MAVWKKVPSLPYEVSDEGEVRRSDTGRLLKPMRAGQKRKQYSVVSLCLNGVQKRFKVHQLVCELFHGPRPVGKVVCHVDDDTLKNSAANLYWGTLSDNARDIARARPNAAVVAEIRKRRSEGERGSVLAREFGVSQQLICDIVKGRCYGYL